MANQYLRSYMDALLSLEQEFDLEAVSQMSVSMVSLFCAMPG